MGTACKQACKGEGAPEDEAGPVQLVHDAGVAAPKARSHNHLQAESRTDICMALKVAYGAERLAASAA